MKKTIVYILALIMTMSIIVQGNTIFASAATTAFPSLSSSAYCETIASKTIAVYKDSAFKTRGTTSPAQSYNAEIWAGDTCKLLSITDSYIKVEYPTSSGQKTGYVKCSAFIGVSSPTEKVTSKGQATTYSKAAKESWGYTEKGDVVYKLGESGNYTQIIYTAKSGNRAYKMGYVLTSDYNSKIISVGSGAVVGAASTVSNDIQKKLDALQQKYPTGTKWEKSFDGAIQCNGFAKLVFNTLYGTYPGAYADGAGNKLVITFKGARGDLKEVGSLTGSNVTASKVKTLMENAQVGDFIQIGYNDRDYPHSMIFLSFDKNNVYVVDCNSDGKCTVVWNNAKSFTNYFEKRCDSVVIYRAK